MAQSTSEPQECTELLRERRQHEVWRNPLLRTSVNNGEGRAWSPFFLPADAYRRPSPWASLQEGPEGVRQLIEVHAPGYLLELDRVQVATPGHPLPQDAPHLDVAPVGVYAQQIHSPQYEGGKVLASCAIPLTPSLGVTCTSKCTSGSRASFVLRAPET
jgi:hypothetical protein